MESENCTQRLGFDNVKPDNADPDVDAYHIDKQILYLLILFNLIASLWMLLLLLLYIL